MNNRLPDYPSGRFWLRFFLWTVSTALPPFCLAADNFVSTRPILGDIGSSVSIPAEPASQLYFDTPRLSWSNNLKKFKLNHTLFTRPEDYNKKGYTFLAFKKCSQPDLQDILLYGRASNDTEAAMKWSKYDPNKEPTAYSGKIINADTHKDIPEPILLTRYFMTTDETMDISALVHPDYSRDCGQFFAGYGLGETTTDAFYEMLKGKRFEIIFDTVLGIRASGSYRLEVKVISFVVESLVRPIPLCPSAPELDIGCP